MVYKSRPRGETGFPMQTCLVGGEKTIGDPPTDPLPQEGHWVQDGRGGLHTTDQYRRIGARSKRARDRQRWGARPIPGRERRQIVASAAFTRVYLLEKWGLGSKEGVKIKPSHFRWDCG